MAVESYTCGISGWTHRCELSIEDITVNVKCKQSLFTLVKSKLCKVEQWGKSSCHCLNVHGPRFVCGLVLTFGSVMINYTLLLEKEASRFVTRCNDLWIALEYTLNIVNRLHKIKLECISFSPVLLPQLKSWLGSLPCNVAEVCFFDFCLTVDFFNADVFIVECDLNSPFSSCLKETNELLSCYNSRSPWWVGKSSTIISDLVYLLLGCLVSYGDGGFICVNCCFYICYGVLVRSQCRCCHCKLTNSELLHSI